MISRHASMACGGLWVDGSHGRKYYRNTQKAHKNVAQNDEKRQINWINENHKNIEALIESLLHVDKYSNWVWRAILCCDRQISRIFASPEVIAQQQQFNA